MLKNVLTLSFLIIGTTIGAGFASGKELAVFFGVYGLWGIVFSLLFGVLFFYFNYKFFKWGHILKPKNFNDISKFCLGKYYKMGNVLFVVCFIISVTGMIAGSAVISNSILNNKFIVPIVFIVITSLTIIKGIKGINFINNCLVPILVFSILYLCAKTFFVNSSGYILSHINFNIVGALISCCCYVSMNVIASGILIMQIANNYSKKEVKISCIITSVVLTIIIIFAVIAFLFSSSETLNSAMPFLEMCKSFNKTYYVYFSFITLVGILTTLVSSAYLVVCYFNSFLKNVHKSLFLTFLISLVLALIGFGNIVKFLYPITGIIGVVFMVGLNSKFIKKTKKQWV